MTDAQTESGVIRFWVNAVLKQDTTLAALAPGGIIAERDKKPGLGTPFIAWGVTSGPFPHRGSGGAKVGYADARLSVTVWTRSSDYRLVDPIIGRHKALMNGAAGHAAGGLIFGCEWLQDLEPPEDTSNPDYLTFGYTTDYHVWAATA